MNKADSCSSHHLIRFSRPGFPLRVSEETILHACPMREVTHYHDDIECVYVLEGNVTIKIDDRKYIASAGDTFFINAYSLHRMGKCGDSEGRFLSLSAHPALLTPNEWVQNTILGPFLNSSSVKALLLSRDTPYGKAARQIMEGIHEMLETGSHPSLPLYLISKLHELLALFYEASPDKGKHREEGNPDIVAQRNMIAYIMENYGEKISPSDISEAGHVSRTKCFQIFNQYVGQSPMEYLNTFRLEKSRSLLEETKEPIISISTQVGFGSQSYYTQQFSKAYGVTPKKYRTMHSALSAS